MFGRPDPFAKLPVASVGATVLQLDDRVYIYGWTGRPRPVSRSPSPAPQIVCCQSSSAYLTILWRFPTGGWAARDKLDGPCRIVRKPVGTESARILDVLQVAKPQIATPGLKVG